MEWGGIIAVVIIAIIFVILVILTIVFLTRSSGGGLNDACTTSSNCGSGYVCVSGVCKGSIGTTCASTSDCATGLTCQASVCVVPTPAPHVNNPGNPIPLQPLGCPIAINSDPSSECNDNQSDNSYEQYDYGSYNNQGYSGDQGYGYMAKGSGKRDMYSEYETISHRELVSGSSSERRILDNHSFPNNEIEDTSITETGSFNKTMIDACSYSNMILYLFKDNTIYRKNSDGRKEYITNHVDILYNNITRIESFNGFLYSVIDGQLHKLDNKTLNTNKWKWSPVTVVPKGIKYMSKTLMDSHLCLQYQDYTCIYDSKFSLINKVSSKHRRIYGKSLNEYIDIDVHNHIAYVFLPNLGKKKVRDVYDAVITYHNEVLFLTSEDMKVHQGIRLINWEAHYISNN